MRRGRSTGFTRVSWQEYLLLAAAPIIALAVLGMWVVTLAKGSNVVDLKLNFLGLALTIRTCGGSKSDCLRARRAIMKGIKNGNNENEGHTPT